MARYTGPSCRVCRREGVKLFLKGDRCYTGKCAITRREYAPGQHGQQRKKLSEYGIQLREKQKAKKFYGVLETQFRKYFELAVNKKGITGSNLLQILETRFDNVVYRLGYANSRAEARQLVRHGHFKVNGQKVNIPSYLVSAGDIIEVREKSRDIESIKSVEEVTRAIPKWLEIDKVTLVGKVLAIPAREEVDLPVKEHYIVELYSK
jgi:small subunit ribosomal protein S4